MRKWLRSIVERVYRSSTKFSTILHGMRRFVRFIAWNIRTSFSLLVGKASSKKRILLIYDTSSQPLSIGDIIIVQAASLALLRKYQCESVDFVLLYDPSALISSDQTYSEINNDNIFYYLSSVLPISQINQFLGSVMVLNSKELLTKIIVDNAETYEVWPSSWRFASRDYLYYEIFDKVIYRYYKETGQRIRLICRPFLLRWAKDYFLGNTHPQIPVTINIRNNQAYQQHRNSNLDVWYQFFLHCESLYPVKFIIICSQSEIDEKFRELSNVLFSKDIGAGIEQELALIQSSALHMGVGSGPISMAWFGDRPYLMVNTKYPPGYFENEDMLVSIGEGLSRFCFATEFQRIYSEVETVSFLIEQFSILMREVNINEWQSQSGLSQNQKNSLSTWLR
jgi:hypothetical protein